LGLRQSPIGNGCSHILVHDLDVSTASTAEGMLATGIHLAQFNARDGLDDLAWGIKDTTLAAQVAGIMVCYGLLKAAETQTPFSQEACQELA
jgi:hypothetical protein